jgi:hypothetical protein
MTAEEFHKHFFMTNEEIGFLETRISGLIAEIPTEHRGKALEIKALSEAVKGMRCRIDNLVQEMNRSDRNSTVSDTYVPDTTFSERVPKSTHKRTLMNYLSQRPFAHRREILRDVKIPSATLTEVLKDTEFAQIGRGMYTLSFKRDEAQADFCGANIVAYLACFGPKTLEEIYGAHQDIPDPVIDIVLNGDDFCEIGEGVWSLRSIEELKKQPGGSA